MSIVVDTNVFMERLSLLGRLRDNLRVLARRLQQRVALVPRLVVPSVVLLELDNFKDPHKARGEQQPRAAGRGLSLEGYRAPGSAAWDLAGVQACLCGLQRKHAEVEPHCMCEGGAW